VLTNPGARAQLEEVPLNGGAPVPVSTQPGTVSVSADGASQAAGLSTGPNNGHIALAAALGNGQIYVTAGIDVPWQQVGVAGQSPVYPG
jgi:hypothetical protein